MYCNFCGGENPGDALFCGFCARPLQPDAGLAAGEQAGAGASEPTIAMPAGEPTASMAPAPPPVPGNAPRVLGQVPLMPAPGQPAVPSVPVAYTCVVCGYVLGPYETVCPRCSTPRGMSVNPDAPVPGTYQPVAGAWAYQAAAHGNTSGMKAMVPPEVAGGWNWGGCTLGCFWAFAMGLPWWGVSSLLSWLCCTGIYLPLGIVMGIKGNEWAWQNRRFESIEHFRLVQRKWATWGIVVASAIVVLYVLYVALTFAMAFSSGPTGGHTFPF